MASMTYIALRDAIKNLLQDSANAIWTSTELDLLIADGVREISQYQPRKVKHTLTTTASIDLILTPEAKRNLIDIENKVEYKVGQTPRQYHNFTRDEDDVLTLKISAVPTPQETARLFLGKKHIFNPPLSDLAGKVCALTPLASSLLVVKELGTDAFVYEDTTFLVAGDATLYTVIVNAPIVTNIATLRITPPLVIAAPENALVTLTDAPGDAPSTLDTELERMLIELVAAKAAISKSFSGLNVFMSEDKWSDINSSISDMSDRFTVAVTNLLTGEGLIAEKRTEAIAAIEALDSMLLAAIDNIASGEALVGEKRTEAIAAIDNMNTQILQAIEDITSAEAIVSEQRPLAIAAIEESKAEIDLAIADIVQARTFFETVALANPDTNYLRSAGVELSAAGTKLSEARAHEGLNTDAVAYSNQAMAQLRVAGTSLQQARAYMALNNDVGVYSNQAMAQLRVAGTSLQQARAYMALNNDVGIYSNQAMAQLRVADSHARQTQLYLSRFNAKSVVARIANQYQQLGNQRLNRIMPELARLRSPKVATMYSRG